MTVQVCFNAAIGIDVGKKQLFAVATHSLSLALVAAATRPAYADAAEQEGTVTETPGQVSTERRTVFPPEEFERFAPKNALDMIIQIPGFVIREEDQGRGLGQANENVIVNGARLSSKSDGLRSQLQRIGADKVVRIELVDGAALGIPGLTGQVANVVTKAGGLSGQFEYRARFRAHYAYPQWLAGEASINGSTGNLEYTISLSNNDGRGAAGGPWTVSSSDGSLIESRRNVLKLRDDDPKLTTTIKWDGPGSSVGNFSGMYRHGYFRLRENETREGPGIAPYRRLYGERWRGKEYELGGDFEFALGPGRLKLIALDQFLRSRFHATSISDFSDATPSSGDRFENDTERGERIIRGEYSWKMAGGDWQLAAEGAFNRLDRVSRLGPLRADGGFDTTFFAPGSGGVREDRYEVILTHGRPLAKNLTVRLGIGGEYSKLVQAGTDGLVRQFWRPKGSLTVAWDPSRLVDVNAKIERKVGQLDFGDFLGAVFLDRGNANEANARLVPPQSWNAEVEFKFDLNKWGSSTVRVFGDKTEDYIDLIPLADLSGEFRGNVPKSRLYGIEWTGTFNLDPIGFKGAKVESEMRFENSSLRDPLTRLKRSRSWHGYRKIEVSLRHDVPDTPWAWSLGFDSYRQKPYYRLREVGSENEGPVYLYGFIEHKDVFGATLRLTVFNLNDGRNYVRRTVYEGPRDRSPVARNEYARRLIGPLFNISLKGNF